MDDSYPARGKGFFLNRYMAHVLRSAVGLECGGGDAVALLLAVALTEDKVRYKRAVNFWNDQLMAYMACRESRLRSVRTRLVEAGWLHYEAGRKSHPGTYWVLVPGGDQMINDAVLGSENENFDGQNALSNALSNSDLYVGNALSNALSNATSNQRHPYLLPNPIPKEEIDKARAREVPTASGPRDTFLTGTSEAFKTWWETYPKREGEKAAWSSYQRALAGICGEKGLNDSEAEQYLLMATSDYAASPSGRKPTGDGDFRPSPAKWLDSGRWADDRDLWQKPNGNSKGKSNGRSSDGPGTKFDPLAVDVPTGF